MRFLKLTLILRDEAWAWRGEGAGIKAQTVRFVAWRFT